jgi:hypothetical protein
LFAKGSFNLFDNRFASGRCRLSLLDIGLGIKIGVGVTVNDVCRSGEFLNRDVIAGATFFGTTAFFWNIDRNRFAPLLISPATTSVSQKVTLNFFDDDEQLGDSLVLSDRGVPDESSDDGEVSSLSCPGNGGRGL